MILLQILSTANVFFLFLSLSVILVSIIYGFVRGRAAVAMLVACVVVFLLQQISHALGEFPDLTFMLSEPLWMVYGNAYALLTTFLPSKTASALALEIAGDPFIFLGGISAPLASTFLHGDVTHIFFNMIFLFFVGMPLEQRVGSRDFMLVYIVSGLVGSFCQYATSVPGIGASGALMGVFGAFAYLYPHERFFVFPLPVPIQANILLLLFVAIEFVSEFAGMEPSVAHLAHLGGILGGIAVAYFLKRHTSDGSPLIRGDGGRVLRVRTTGGKKLNTYGLYTINSNLELIQDAAREEIREVKRAKIDGIVNSGTCPQCGSRPEIRGNSVVCKHCGYSFSLYE